HDLRTPVRHVMSFADLAQKALTSAPNEKVGRNLKVIKQAAERMSSLIDGMLVLSRTSRAELSSHSVDLNLLVAQARQDVGSEFVHRPVHWQIQPLPQVWGDPRMLQSVLTNLIRNAVKYSSTREVSRISIWAQEQDTEWLISVQDNGVGFDPKYSDRLFGVFQRLHHERDFEGIGVGLATVRRIVLKHGGQVFVEGQPEQGATFGFTLPKRG
ncbi:MAG: sensor histidine kinase, partial [Deinococcus sp.]